MRIRARWIVAAVLSFRALASSHARAQGLEGSESEELRALRLGELELFPHLEPATARFVSGMPDALVASTAEGSNAAMGARADRSWLTGLQLPDLPVRWDERVVRYLEYFRDDPRGRGLIRSWVQRMERFGPTIRQTLREEGLPEDILYLAMIESGFDPRARSDAGAVGLWQFVSATGEEYGLEQNHWVDERMDPIESTRAGARYLGALYRRFGRWELAFAAYNMGYGALLRAIRRHGTNDYWVLSRLEGALPFETNLYVAKVMACAVVGRNLERFGLGALDREVAMTWDEVEVPGGTALVQVARAANVEIDAVRRLNPSLRRDRTPPHAESFRVRVPAGSASVFSERWPRQRGRSAYVPAVVRMGEDLATLARRHGTTEANLREINGLVEGQTVRPGVGLMVPAGPVREVTFDVPPVAVVPERTFEYPGRRRLFYRVGRGDSLADVARFFGVTVAEVLEWNTLDPEAALTDGLFVQLFVPSDRDLGAAIVLAPEQVQVLVLGSEAFYAHHAEQDGRVRIRVTVREGDTLSSIATRFGISIGSLCRVNLLPRDAVLSLGQTIVVYANPSDLPAEYRHAAPPAGVTGEEIAEGDPEATELASEGPPAP